MATDTEHRLAQARAALHVALLDGLDPAVVELCELAYLAAVLDAQDACGAVSVDNQRPTGVP